MAIPATTSFSDLYPPKHFRNATTGELEAIQFGVALNSTTTEVIVSTLTNNPDIITAWMEEDHPFRRPYKIEDPPEDNLIVGLDVKTSPDGKIALVTLAAGLRCLVYQMHPDTSPPISLYNAFEDLNALYVGVNVPAMVDRMKVAFGHWLDVRRWKNLGEWADKRSRRSDMAIMGVDGLAEQILGINVIPPPMDIMPEEWDTSVLEPEHVMYAARDAFLCFRLGKLLNAWK